MPSAEQTASPQLAPPDKPTGFQASPGHGHVLLQWDNPYNSSITKWQYKQGAGNWQDVCLTSSDSGCPSVTAHLVTGLTNGTSYSFKVRAVNASTTNNGVGAESDPASATPLAVPGQPTDFTATGGDRQVEPGPGRPRPPAQRPTGWQYRMNSSDFWQPWRTITTPGTGQNNTLTHTVTHDHNFIPAARLWNNHPYRFQVRATNASGGGTPTAPVSAVPVSGAPVASNYLWAVGGDGQVTLRWNRMAGPWVTHWQYRYKTGSGDYGSWDEIPGSWNGTVFHTFTTDNGKRYTFQVRPVNDADEGGPSPEAVVDTRPLAPTLTAMAGDEEVVLDWAKNSGDGATATAWQYQYKTTGGYGAWTTVPAATDATRAYTVTGLDNDTVYTFKVRAVNDAGPGPASVARSATPKVQLPDKPTGLSAAIGHTKVALSWDNPYNDRITGWRYSTDNGLTWTDVPNSGASTTGYTVPGLDNGTAYTFRVRAVTSAGAGSASDPVTATPKAVPNPPGSLAAAPGDSGEIDLTWTAISAATDWEVRYKAENAGYGSWTDVCDSNCTAGTLAAHTVTGLHNRVLYTFQVRARNSIGWGLPATATARSVAGAPTAPTLAKAVGGDGRVTLAWTYGGARWVDTWQYSSDGGTNWSNFTGSNRFTRSGTVTGLTNGTSYTFKVRAVNGKGEGTASASKTATTLPFAPATFSASGGDREASLTWSKSGSDATVTGWQYRYKPAGVNNTGYTGWTNVPNSVASTTTYDVTGLSNSVTYTLQLRAVNATGGGAASSEVTASTVPAGPTGLSAAPGDQKVTLSWTNPSGGASLTDTEYRYKPKASDDSDYTDWTAIGSVVTTKEVAGLDRGVRYTFQVRAVNATGDGTPSSAVSAWTYPAAPANLTAAPGDKLVSLTWDDPSNPSITRYEYQQTTSGSCSGAWTSMADSNADTTQFVKSGLTNGTDYTFCVRAYSAGAGATSAKATAQPQPLPAMPASADATATDASSATVTWSYATLSLIEKFQVRYRAGAEAWGSWADVAKTTTPLAYTVSTGLTRGTVYTFEVRAVNNQSEAGPAAQARAATAPAKPTGLSAAPGFRQVTLTWDDPDYTSITHWQYSKDNGTTWTNVPSSTATTTSVTVGGLTSDTSYAFKVRAVNAAGNGHGLRRGVGHAARQAHGAHHHHPDRDLRVGHAAVLLPEGELDAADGHHHRQLPVPADAARGRPDGLRRRPLRRTLLEHAQRHHRHRQVAVPLQAKERVRLPDQLDQRAQQQRGHCLGHRGQPDQRHGLPLPGARRDLGERARRRGPRRRGGDALGLRRLDGRAGQHVRPPPRTPCRMSSWASHTGPSRSAP